MLGATSARDKGHREQTSQAVLSLDWTHTAQSQVSLSPGWWREAGPRLGKFAILFGIALNTANKGSLCSHVIPQFGIYSQCGGGGAVRGGKNVEGETKEKA